MVGLALLKNGLVFCILSLAHEQNESRLTLLCMRSTIRPHPVIFNLMRMRVLVRP